MEFTLPLPPTLNETYKIGNNRFYKSKAAKDWQEEVGWIIKTKKTLKGAVLIEIDMYLKRDRDIDSSLKLILDTLAESGIYENDKQVEQLVVKKEIDKKNPRMEIMIVSMNS